MTKEIKLELVIETNDDAIVDELVLQNAISSLGKIKSCNIGDNIIQNNESTNVKEIPTNISGAMTHSNSEIRDFLDANNKIYFESMTVSERKLLSIHILINSNFEKIQSDNNCKDKLVLMLTDKFELDSEYINNCINSTKDNSLLEIIISKLLEADLNMIFIFIFRNVLSKGDDNFFEIELVENSAGVFSIENINDIQKMANERVKVIKAIKIIESDELAFNKLKALEKNVLLALVLLECSKVDGKISKEEINHLKNTFNTRLDLSENISSFIFQKDTSEASDQKQFDSLIMKIEKNVTYKEKYELLVYLWEKLLSTEREVDQSLILLIKKLLRKFDMSDIESNEAKKEAEAIVEESKPDEEE